MMLLFGKPDMIVGRFLYLSNATLPTRHVQISA